MSGDRGEHLTEQQFHDHLRKIYDNYGSNDESSIGRHFWRACETYSANGTTEHGWSRPRQAFILHVDREISTLMKREVPPRIEYKGGSYPFPKYGPFALVRLRMGQYLDSMEDPGAQADHQDKTLKRLDFVEELISRLEILISIDYVYFAPRSSRRSPTRTLEGRLYDVSQSDEVIREALARCGDAANSLIELRYILRSERSLGENQYSKTGRGRRRNMTKDGFIGMAADLWADLTGESASRDDQSLFASFVSSIWYSYDEDAPDVSFSRALRDRP